MLACVILLSCSFFSSVLAGCPSDYPSQYGESCYKVVKEKEERAVAASKCAEDNAHLADIKSAAVHDFISDMLRQQRVREAWFGLSAHEFGGELLWSDGSPLDFTAWAENGRDEEVDCVRLKKGFGRDERVRGHQWMDRSCLSEYSFICEYEIGRHEHDNDDEGLQLPTNAPTTAPIEDDGNHGNGSHTGQNSESHTNEDNESHKGDDSISHTDEEGNGSHTGQISESHTNEDNESHKGDDSISHTDEATYLGCYVDAEERAIPGNPTTNSSMTLQMCFDYCRSLDKRFAGAQLATQCFCGSDGINFARHGAANESECDKKCAGNTNQVCGGTWRLSVYDVDPSKHGNVHVEHPSRRCNVPKATISNQAPTQLSAHNYTRSTPFTLQGRVNATCHDFSLTFSYQWGIRRFSASHQHIGDFKGERVGMPSSVSTAHTDLIIPGDYLRYGYHRFEFSVLQLERTSERIMSYDSTITWVQIMPSALVPVIAGGSARTQGSSVPIVMDASDSHDPDTSGPSEWEAMKPMSFAWFCQMSGGEEQLLSGAEILELLEVSSNATNVTTSTRSSQNSCFGDSISLPYTDATWDTDDEVLMEGKAYLFTMVLGKPNRNKVFAQQRVSILPGNPPQMTISCMKNCGQRMVAEKRLILEGICTADCGTALQYNWELISMAAGEVMNPSNSFWKAQTTTGRNSATIVFKAGTFNVDDEIAALRVTGTKLGGSSGYAEFAISINEPPESGSCEVAPTLGYALQTHFNVICEDFVDEDIPLTYSIMAAVHEEEETPSLLYTGTEAESPDMHLPLGAAKYDNVVQLLVEVKDALGATTTVRLEATVLPPQVDASADTTDFLLNLTTGEHNELQEYVSVGDYQLVTQIVGTVGSVLNEEAADETETEEERKEKELKRIQIRDALVDSLNEIPVDSIGSLQQTSSSLALVTKAPSEVSQETQLKAATTFTHMGSFLKSQSSGGDEDQEVIESAASSIVAGLSNIMGAAAVTTHEETLDSGDNRTQNMNKSRSVSMATLTTLTDVHDALVANKIRGESPTTIATESVTMTVNRQEREALVSSPIKPSGLPQSSSFVLPVLDEVKKKIPVGYTGAIDSQMTELAHNPFAWSQSESEVNSPVIGLQLKTTERDEIQMENLKTDVDIFVQVPSTLIESTPPPMPSNLTLDGVAIVVFNVSDTDTTLRINVHPDIEGGAHLLCCLMEAGLNATSPCEHNSNVPRGLSSNKGVLSSADLSEADYTWTLPPGTLDQEGSYQLVVSIYNNTDRFAGVTVPITTHVSTSECVFWDEVEETWSDKGCKVGALSTRHQTHCRCNHLSYFASNFLVKPNKVDFFADAKLFLTFVDNPVVVTTVGVILVVYVAAAIWARKKDKRDQLQTEVIILPDSDPFAHYRYVVTVKTGMRRGAGTSATVTLTLTGENGSSLSHVLQDKKGPVLQRGRVEAFLITTRESLGELQEMRVWHDNEGESPGWYVTRVMVHDLETDERWLFLCNKWLAVDMSDGLIDKRFAVATNEQLKKFSNLFGDRTTRGLTDGHLWFSVLSRPARSHFTRLQRLSCCLCLLMTTMLTSIMFYGIPDDPTDQAMDFGSFRITVREIIIGIESAIIAFPINLIIVQIFRMSQSHRDALDYAKPKLPSLKAGSSKSSGYQSSIGESLQRRSISLPSSSTFEMANMSGDTKLEEVKLEVHSGEAKEVDSKSDSWSYIDEKFKDKEVESISNSWSSLDEQHKGKEVDSSWSFLEGQHKVKETQSKPKSCSSLDEQFASCTSFNKDLRVAFKSDMLNRAETSDYRNPSLQQFAEDTVRKRSSSSSSRFKRPASANMQSEQCKSSEGGSGGSFSKYDSSESARPMSHNEVLLSKLQNIAADLEKMTAKESKGDLKAAQERSQAWILLAKSLRTPESTVSSLSSLSTNVGNDVDSVRSSARKRGCHGLPHWFVYIGWLILILTTGISAYYIMLYGLKYGKQRSIDWLVSLMVSTFQEIFITQPLKIFMFAAFVAMILKKWEEDDDGGTEIDEIDIETINAEFEYKHMMRKRRESTWYRPPPLANVSGARIRKIREQKMYALLREICGYVFFVWLVLMLAYSNRDRNSYYLTKHVKDLYFDNKIYHKVFVDLRGFFVWTEEILIPTLYGDGYGSDMQSDLLGGVRLRQVRVKRDSCETAYDMKNVIDSCNAPYSRATEDKASYNGSWTSPTESSSWSHDPWLYHTHIAGRFWGRVDVYEGGGYMANLGSTSEEALATLAQLRESLWLDDLTRALFVEWTVYNANTNLFCVVTFSLEMPGTGGFFKYPYIQSVRLYRSVANYHLFMIAIEVIFLFYVFYYTYVEISKYRQQRRDYFRNIWNWVEFTSILLCLGIISVYIKRYVVMKRLAVGSSWDKFVSFHEAANVADAFIYLFAFLVIVSTIKFLHLLRLNPRLYLLTTVISQSGRELFVYSVLVLVYVCSFTSLATLLFGSTLYNYHSYKMAFANLFNLLLGTFDHQELLMVNRLVTPIVVITYEAIALYLFMNLFIAALSIAMTNVRRNPRYSEDGKLGLLLIDKLLSLFGIDNRGLQKHLNW